MQLPKCPATSVHEKHKSVFFLHSTLIPVRTHLFYTTPRRIETVQPLESIVHASFNAYRLSALHEAQ